MASTARPRNDADEQLDMAEHIARVSAKSSSGNVAHAPLKTVKLPSLGRVFLGCSRHAHGTNSRSGRDVEPLGGAKRFRNASQITFGMSARRVSACR